jgi:outer membrane protein
MLSKITTVSVSLLTLTGTLMFSTSNDVKAGDFDYTVGAVTGLTSDYIGSDDYDVFALPILGVRWEAEELAPKSGGYNLALGLRSVSVNFPEGLDIGLMSLDTPERTHTLNVGLGYDGGRDDGDNDALKGMGDIGGHVIGNLSIGSEGRDPSKSDWYYAVEFARDMSGEHDGSTISGVIGYSWPLSKSLSLSTDIGMTWADKNYMQANFGVSDTQANNSTHDKYSATSGLMGAEATAALQWMITDNWVAFGELSYSRLTGDAADSPLVKTHGDADAIELMTGIVYAF